MRRLLATSAACAAALAAFPSPLAAGAPAAPARVERAPLPAFDVLRPEGRPRGSILVVHGGGWRQVGRERMARAAPAARRFRDWGYEVWNTTYRPGRASLEDVLRMHDLLRDRSGRRVCIYGRSAGGHLGLSVAARRPGVAGVISAAGPTSLPTLPPHTRKMAHEAFGAELSRFSPLAGAERIRARLLLEYGRRDRLVPLEQGRAMAAAAADAALLTVPARPMPIQGSAPAPAGTVSWVHGWITPRVARALAERERRWLAATCDSR